MLTKTFISVTFAFSTLLCLGQSNFRFSDSTFEIGETFTTHGIRFELNKPDLLLDSVCKPVVDSIIEFIAEHPELTIEIGVHTDITGWRDRSFHLTEVRARNLRSYFIENGANAQKVVPVGYECAAPIHVEAYVNQFKETDPEKFNQLRRENKRVTLKILAID